MKKIRTIVLCSSASFYEKLFPVKKELEKLGFKVAMPKTALEMKRKNNFDRSFYQTWQKNPKDYHIKRALMNGHFKKIINGDAILVANFDKKGIKGYIGGNVFMEITIAYHYKKPVFILNDVSEDSSIIEEIRAVEVKFLKGSLAKLHL